MIKILRSMKITNLEFLPILSRLTVKKKFSTKVYLLYVIIEKMINVPLGQYSHQKCYMIAKRKQFIMIML